MTRMEKLKWQVQRFDDYMTFSWTGNAIVMVLMALCFLLAYFLAP